MRRWVRQLYANDPSLPYTTVAESKISSCYFACQHGVKPISSLAKWADRRCEASSERPFEHHVTQKVKSIKNQNRRTLDGFIYTAISDGLQSDALMQTTSEILEDALGLQRRKALRVVCRAVWAVTHLSMS